MLRSEDQKAEAVLKVVRQYLEQTARKHPCVGWNCATCSVDGERGQELLAEILRELRR